MKKMLIAAAALAAIAGPATAYQTNGYYLYEWTYYSDASKTQEVGYQIDQCHDYAMVSGEVTAHYTRVRSGWFNYSPAYCVMY